MPVLDRLPLRVSATLGVAAIVGFGAWLYGYGVLLEPIRADTGWSESVLSATYGVSLLAGGALATVVGRLLHSRGSRVVYAVGAGATLTAYLALAAAGTQTAFAVLGVVAGGLTGALGTYAAVHTVIGQLVDPEARATAITRNTLWGAFASPLFLPLIAGLVLSVGWRPTVRLVGVALAVALLAVATLVPDSRGGGGTTPSLRAVLVAAGRDRTIAAVLATTFLGGLVTSLLLLYQVPVMVTAGLSLGLASALAGARGFLQLVGRIPMPWVIRRLGSRTTLRLAHALTGASCLLLPLTGAVPFALAFALVAGVAIGALVPAESIFTADAVSTGSLGVVLGVASLARGIGAALGPVVGGVLSGVVGSRTPGLVALAGLALVAAWVVPPARGPSSAAPAAG